MNRLRISLRTRRVWLWLFAALLSVALFAVIRERQSWQPHEFVMPDPQGDWGISHLQWLGPNHLGIRRTGVNLYSTNQVWVLDTNTFSLDFKGLVSGKNEPGDVILVKNGEAALYRASNYLFDQHFYQLESGKDISLGDLRILTAREHFAIGLYETVESTHAKSIRLVTWDLQREQKLYEVALQAPTGFLFTPGHNMHLIEGSAVFSDDAKRGALLLFAESSALN